MSVKERPSPDLERLAAIVHSSEDAILSKTMDGIVTSWNRGAEKIYGYTAEEVVGKHVSILVPIDQPNEIPRIMERLGRGEVIGHYETLRRKKDGTIIDVSLTISPVRDVNGLITGASAVARDITEEKRLRVERTFLAAIIDGSDDAILSKDLRGIILSWNRGAEKMYGYLPDEIIGRPVSILTPPGKANEIPEILQRIQCGEQIEPYETKRLRRDGTEIDVSLAISPIRDIHGRIVAASSIARDISQKKQAESIIRAQLKEKDVLIQEVFHRVKNNLQLVSSLLQLRSRHIKDQDGLAAFQDSIARIQAMALVHEKIYQSDNVAKIEFGDYLRSLIEPLIASYTKDHKIAFSVSGDQCYFELNMAVPLGMIMNELITNSLKYAFPSMKQGRIAVRIKKDGNVVTVSVSDNGIGLPAGVDFSTSGTFGFRIVRLLGEQLKASIQVRSNDGTGFDISVPADFSKARSDE